MKNLILIYGNEEYLKEQKKQELLNKLGASGSMNFNSFSDENLDLTEIRGLIETLPMLEEYRKLLITNSGLFKKAGNKDAEDETEQEVKSEAEPGENIELKDNVSLKKNAVTENPSDVTAVFSDMPESTVVLFVENNVSAQSPMYKLVKKNGEIFKYETVESKKGQEKRSSEQSVRAWALGIFKAAGRSIDGATLNYLVQLTGYDMENLSNEIEKLLCFMLDKPVNEKITIKHIDAVCSKTLSDKVFAMLEAKMKGSLQEATAMLEELFSLKVAPMKILYLLVRQYNQALSVKELQSLRMSDAEIMAKTELKDWQLRRIKEQTARISPEEIESALEACADMEYRVKTGSMADRLALELLMA